MKEYLGEGGEDGLAAAERLRNLRSGSGCPHSPPTGWVVPREFFSLAQPGRCDCSWNKILPCLRRAEWKVHSVLLLETLFSYKPCVGNIRVLRDTALTDVLPIAAVKRLT